MTSPGHLTGLRPDSALLDALRADLLAADFTVEGVQQRLGPVAAAALHREQAIPARRAVRGDDPLGVLIRLFTLGCAESTQAIDAALPTTGAAGLVTLGLTSSQQDSSQTGSSPSQSSQGQSSNHRARFDLRPYGADDHRWWLLSDLSELITDAPLADEHVLGLGGASITLASWTPRRTAANALDMGAGSGVQSLHLSTHCDRVTATDLSEQAVEIAAFNAGLNGLDWQLRLGSLFEPVAGQRFDLVVSNPPFVITPRVEGVPQFEYRDGGMVGDALVRTVVQQVEQVLEPGGVAQLLGNWEVRAGQDWTDVVRGWLEPTGLDAWVVQRETQDPAEYAELWARDGGHRPGSASYVRMYEAWLDDFAERGVDRVGFGVITLQRPAVDRRPFRVLEEHTGPVASPMGPSVDRELVALTWTAEHPGRVLDQPWRVADDVTEERFFRPGDEDPSVIRITQGSGLGRQIHIDTVISGYLSVADGDLTARQAISAIAALLERDATELLDRAEPIVTRLVETGFLVPADA
ncbi:DUF7059 domain-containing protein [Calidifontibacter terrae]